MKKTMIVVCLVSLLLLLVSGCAQQEPISPPVAQPPGETPEAPAETTEEAPAFQWPARFSIGSVGAGSAVYGSIVGWTTLLESDTGMLVRSVPEDTPTVRMQWLKGGMVDLNVGTPVDVADSLEARHGFATLERGPLPARIVWQLSATPFGFAVSGDSDIESIYDIKPGHRIAVPVGHPAIEEAIKGLLAWIELSENDVTFVPTTDWTSNTKALPDGRADVAYTSPISIVTVEVEGMRSGLRWLPLPVNEDLEGYERFQEYRPDMLLAPAAIGVESARGVLMASAPLFLYALEDTDPELIYNLATWLHENFDRYQGNHDLLPNMKVDYLRDTLNLSYVPVHEGTIQFLKEQGLWTEKDDMRQSYNIQLMEKYTEAFNDAVDMAALGEIRINPENEEWLELWEDYKKQLQLPRFRAFAEVPTN